MPETAGFTAVRQAGESVSVMLTRTMEFIDNRHTPDHEDVLRDLADSIGRLGPQIFPRTPVALVLCPEHAQMFADAGLSKAGVQQWLIEHSGRTAAQLRAAGKGNVVAGDEEFHRVLSEPGQIPVIVAGAKTAAISMVVRIFGEWSGTAVPVGEKK